MAGSIVNTLRYGNKKTKRLLYFLILLGAVSVLLGMFAFLFGNAALGVLAVAVLFTDSFLLAKTNFSKLSMQEQEKEKQGGQKPRRKKEKQPKKEKLGKEGLEKEESGEEEEERGALEWVSSEKKKEAKEGKEEEEEHVGKEPSSANPLLQYDEKQMKKVFVAYKVRREHVPIMVDYCQAERISQCPAYLWKDSDFLYFLLLEEEARMVKCPISEADSIHIRRGIPARMAEEYIAMQEKSLVGKVFAPYLPNYYRADNGGIHADYRKNRYSLAPGIWCTSASVQNMLKILKREFYIEEDKVNSDDYSPYFRKIYVCRFLYRDMVFSASEYDGKVRETLGQLAHADISDDTFHYYLAQMVMGGLIPQEYADFAMSRRGKKKRGA